ncbi:MAG: molecular chaperone HtpG [Rhodospirillaceae bacterium]|nr:molecular chaperone HtpG [Rhodospirillaceae bacterium]
MTTEDTNKPADQEATANAEGTGETHTFQAEVSRLLDIVANALYSEKEIFIRELVSNAADACDRLRYAAITQPDLVEGDADYAIALSTDKDARTLTFSDNGIGMSREELIGNLGTIARSGSSAFVEQLSGDAKNDVSLIGQFGVGFYSCFMVADKVEVVSRRAGEDQAWQWTSDGKGAFTVTEAERDGRGTTITVHLKEDESDYAETFRVQTVVKTYSDHIAFPITVSDGSEEGDPEPVNTASALWTRPRNDITEQQYTEFFHHVSHMVGDPWSTLHFRAEGMIEYTGLLYIPSSRPFDLYNQDRTSKVRLYVKRVFITEDCEELVPRWLRFLRGVIDSEDLPLNISREMLQNNAVLSRIRSGLTSRVIRELESKAEKEPDAYAEFWENFGAVLKEGLYEPTGEKEELLGLARFRSTHDDNLVSLTDYVGRMKEGQKAIYYITGGDVDALARSPQLEGFRSRGIEVLLLSDPVDEFWVPMVGMFEEQPFKSATQGGADFNEIKSADTDADAEEKKADDTPQEDIDRLIAAMKLALGEDVKDIRVSDRLTESAVCLVADEGDMDMNLERLLKAHQQIETRAARILEINPGHTLIKGLAAKAKADSGSTDDAARLLLDQARILEGEPLPDPAAFAQRMSEIMAKGIG